MSSQASRSRSWLVLTCCALAGAIRANQTSNIAILNSTFLNNTGSIGGAISIYNSSVFINGSTFINNTGQQVTRPPSFSAPPQLRPQHVP